MKRHSTSFIFALLAASFLCNCSSDKPLPECFAPLEVIDNRPFVEVKIKNKSYYFVIDTGGFNSIEAEVAREFNLELIDTGDHSQLTLGQKFSGTILQKNQYQPT